MTLPHAKPKTVDQIKENIKHLQKIAKHHAKLEDFHANKANFSRQMHEKILPKFKSMGYTANHDAYMKEEKTSHILNTKQAEFHKSQMQKMHKLIDNHKAELKQFSTPKRKMVVNMPAQQSQQITANVYPAAKDGRYYQRLSKLYHLSIDRDAQKHISNMPEKNTAEKTKEYMHAYKTHPLYEKMAKFMRKAAKRMHTENITTTVTATVRSYNTNLMYEIFNDCLNRLRIRGILENSPNFETEITAAIANHPQISSLEHLKTEK